MINYSLKTNIFMHIFERLKYYIIPSERNGYKSKFLQSNILLYCVILLLVLKIGTILVSINVPQNIFFADITKFYLENSANRTRQSLGLVPLIVNEKLNQAAQLKAENMIQNNYFNHTSPTGVTPWFWFKQVGYNYKYAGENLAVGFFESQQVYEAWLNSPSHRANIINPNYTEVGTAVLPGFDQNNTIVVVQIFGTQLPVKQVIGSNLENLVKKIEPTTAKVNSIIKTTGLSSTTNIETIVTDKNGEVLSQSAEAQISIKSPTDNSTNNFSSKLLNFILYDYNLWLQNIIHGLSSVVIGILLILIFSHSNINFKKQFVFRSVLIIVLLSLATILNNGAIQLLVSYQIAI